jgi:DNA-binding CsgD family transcriptional regulator
MTLLIIGFNIIALILGVVTVIISYKLTREYPLPYLNNYFYFVFCSVVCGFFDWIAYNLIKIWVPDLIIRMNDIIYHIFWGLIGFPCALLAFYYLIAFLYNISGVKQSSVEKRIMIASIIFLSALSLIRVFFFADKFNTLIGSFLKTVYILILPILQLTYLWYLYSRGKREKNSDLVFNKKLFLLIGISFSFWYLLMHLQLVLTRGDWNQLIILGFYLALLIPTVYLYKYQEKNNNGQIFNDMPLEKLSFLFNEYDFTEREKEIMLLLYRGKSNKAIGEELFISLQTVKNYVSKIYKKLNLKTRLELLNYLRNKIG